MAGGPHSGGIERSRAAQLLPLLPLATFLVLAIAAGIQYGREASTLAYCVHLGLDVTCAARVQIQQILAVAWLGAAITLGTLMLIQHFLRARSRPLGLAPRTRLVCGLLLLGLGLSGIAAAEAEGYGRVPYGVGEAFLYSHITGSLFLFGVTFLDFRRPRSLESTVATGIASIHGLIAGISAGAYAFFVAFPPVIAT